MPDNRIELTFLGHQSWHISDGDAVVLLDPILAPAFGAGMVEFPIWPPRAVDVAAMPAPDAVILSHEHHDHFHLPSLDLLDRSVPIYTGTTVPAAAVEAIEALGFTVQRLDHTQQLRIGTLEIVLYPAGARTVFWENRVVQPVVRHDGIAGRDVFIGVDADVSDVYLHEIRAGGAAVPYLAVVSNNSQVEPDGAPSPGVNLMPGADGARKRTTGIGVLSELLVDYLGPLDGVAEVAFCGNGYTTPHGTHGPFLYADHPALAEAANALQQRLRVHGPRPGDRLMVTAEEPVTASPVEWVAIDADAERAGRQALAGYRPPPQAIPAPVTPPLDTDEVPAAEDLLQAELARLARSLVGSPTGTVAAGIHESVGGPLGSHRLVLRLLDPPGRPGDVRSYAWNIADPSMEEVPTLSRDEAMAAYPFGIEVYHQDLVAMFQGRIQIWDVLFAAYQNWYVGEYRDSPLYALLGIYAEHRRPDLHAACYALSLERLMRRPVGSG